MPARSESASDPGSPPVSAPPKVLVVAAVAGAAMGVGLVAYAIFVAYQWVSQEPAEPLNAGLIIGFSLVWGLVLIGCARGLLGRRRWARAPLVTSLLLLLTVGWLLATGTGAEVGFGWAVLVVSGCGLVALLTPTVGRELQG